MASPPRRTVGFVAVIVVIGVRTDIGATTPTSREEVIGDAG